MDEKNTATNKREIYADGWLLYLSIYETFVELSETDPKAAVEYLIALGNYNFYGEEYSGSNPYVKMMAKQEYVHIVKQRDRYAQRVHGGQMASSGNEWEKIYIAARSGMYGTLKALGEAFGTSGQNMGQRLKNHGYTLAQLRDMGPVPPEMLPKVERKSDEVNESRDSESLSGFFRESNHTNTNTNTITNITQPSKVSFGVDEMLSSEVSKRIFESLPDEL